MLSFFLRILNAALFYFGWWYCMHEAVGPTPYYGPLVVLGILFYNIIVSSNRMIDLILILTCALTGQIVDTFYIHGGMIAFQGGYSPEFAPLWVVSLWALYGSSINHSLNWLRKSNILAVVMGGGGAISSYLVGFELGAADLLWPKYIGLALIGVVWGLFVPFSLQYSAWLNQRKDTAPGLSGQGLKDL
jgi:hypothetical protein